MSKKFWLYPMTVSAVMGLLVPWVAVAFLADAGLAVCLIQFFVLEPMVSAWVGWRSGVHPKTLWCLPPASALFFLLGTWLQFEMGEPAFLLYSGIYSGIGYMAMLVRVVYRKLFCRKVSSQQ